MLYKAVLTFEFVDEMPVTIQKKAAENVSYLYFGILRRQERKIPAK